MKEFYLMHKDDIAAFLQMTDDGKTIVKAHIVEKELLPLPGQKSQEGLNTWWKRRAVPISQEGISIVLQNAGVENENEFLMVNCGLSLNDCYWIAPAEGDRMEWANINLFTNDFQSYDITIPNQEIQTLFDPASSTVGELKKRWIIMNDRRYLVKGNSSLYFQQSLNEVLISNFHKKQAVAPYVQYLPISLKTLGEEGIGCISQNFATEDIEFIPAIQVTDSEPKPNDVSWYEHYLNVCEKHGLDKESHRKFMDYMFASDFLFTNTDRHLNNFGILRDSSSLKFLGPAPIFDNGNSLFYKNKTKDLYNILINSFSKDEIKQLQLISDRGIVNLDQMLTKEDFVKVFSQDPNYKAYIDQVLDGFVEKLKLLHDFENGADLDARRNKYKKPIRMSLGMELSEAAAQLEKQKIEQAFVGQGAITKQHQQKDIEH